MDLFPSSGKKKVAPTLLGPLERASLSGPNRVEATFFLPEDGKRSNLRNVVFWTKSKNFILSSAIHHCQNPLQLHF
jgi:hypothetical protein